MPDGERILIIRTSAMGDIVHALPVLTRLRAALPDARIGWVVERVFAPLLEGRPDLDEVITVGLRTWRHRTLSPNTWREIAAFSKAILAFSPDVVLDLMGTHKSGIIAAFTLADRRFGLAWGDRREPSSAVWLSGTARAQGDHAVDRMLSTLDCLELEAGESEVDFGGEGLSEAAWGGGPQRGETFALLHPRTAWANKDYPKFSWAQVVDLLKERTGIETWVGWGPGEQDSAQEVARASGAQALDELATFPQLIALSRRARIVLGGDTGPVHLAHALGTPVVCVMGPTDPARNGPYGSPRSAVVHRLPCSFCHRQLDATKACLLNIAPDRVVEQAVAQLPH
ncbi:MAG: lipopolysaccharide heptosyltransferase I [Thermoanaerobaculia bacterium]